MDVTLSIMLATISSAIVAAASVWLIANRRLTVKRTALAEQRERAVKAESTLEAERAAHIANVAALHNAEQHLRDAFASLSSEALKSSADQFLQLAQERMERQQQSAKSDLSALVEPLRTTLERQEQQVRALEEQRQHAYGTIEEQLRRMTEDQQRLQGETANLVKALRQPNVRGRWGEIQLRRVVELAGLSAQCDFYEQQTVGDDESGRQRPDMQVRLPNQRQIVVDAKVPLEAYLAAIEAPDEAQRAERLAAHARQVRQHVDAMSRREYQRKIDGAYDCVVLFIPGEVFYSAALEHDRELLEYAFGKSVILATPTTLIALLKAVALGWREARLSEEARTVKEEGEKLYRALGKVVEYIGDIGKGLEKSVASYNKTVGSIEARLLPSARRMCELEVSSELITEPKTLEEALRGFSKAELVHDMTDRELVTTERL
jgi:DNA recombination protein RmuC